MYLSKKQQKILSVIQEYVEENNYPPSVREICELVGLKSSSTAHGHLERLKHKGYVNCEPTKPRTLQIVYKRGDNMIQDLKKYQGCIVELVYLDSAGRFTRRRVQIHGIEGANVKVYCLERQAPRTLTIDSILAMQLAIGRAI